MTESVIVSEWLAFCAPRLPLQNPLWAFVHNNILLNFEELPFLDAVREAAALYRARPFETEDFYREELARGRIRRETLMRVLAARLPELAAEPGEQRIDRFLADARLGDRLPALQHLRLAARLDARFPVRHDRHVKDFLVPLIAAYLDQGMATWTSPLHTSSLWEAFAEAVQDTPSWGFDWAARLRRRLRAHSDAGRSVDAIVAEEVREFGPPGKAAEYCLETLFALKGWSGIVWRLESDPGVAPLRAPPKLRLRDWLAALLVVQHAVDEWLLDEQGITREELANVPAPIEETRSLARLEVWQEAYERSFAGELLAHLEGAFRTRASRPPRARAQLGALVCMDDREESFRRALEAPECGVETWGSLGFFGVDMSFQRVGAALTTRQCPPVIEPSRTVRELPLDGEGAALALLEQAGRAGAEAKLAAYFHSRTLIRGIAVSLGLGLVSFVPLVFKTLQPSRISRWRQKVLRAAFPRPRTRVAIDAEGGYSLDEQADIVAAVLRTCGLTREFPRVIATVAHGATSSNNPFRQAYGCGACSGNSGAPNARAFAAMANDVRVRERLAARGLVLPSDVLFVPCLHDTTLDTIEMLDRTQLPAERAGDVELVQRTLELAARANAFERGARFDQGPVFRKVDRERANARERIVQHVQDRGHDLAQPRPEWGHNRVAMCIVGRRELTREVFLDRRSFLVSYDPTQDTDGSTLAAAVLGSVPVAVNIAMDYYFSRVDANGFGAGSKLPLNVVSLLGVLTGSKSDLRIGLARQMIELHEPMRVLVLLEATDAHIRALLKASARLKRLVDGAWMRLGRIDPNTRELELWADGGFAPWRERWDEFPAADAAQAPRGLDRAFDRRAPVRR
jgi:uncharacterized protein YbcC (UPF0753/DUF2309 family)